MPMLVREDWLAQVQEEALEPERRIVDAHHHFFAKSTEWPLYDLDALWADTETHRIQQTVYLECREGYREGGPVELRAVGETEWVDGIAIAARRRPEKAQIGAIIGGAELRLGARVREVLEAHVARSPLFRGIRQIAAWEASGAALSMDSVGDAKLYEDPRFRAGFGALGAMNLVFDAWHYHYQTPYLTALARAFPTTEIVLDHLGTPLGVGPYAAQQEAIYVKWARDLAEIARCPNVSIKLGGLTLPWTGFGFEGRPRPPTSDDIVRTQSRYYHYAIDKFGPERCMFESNFPVEKYTVSYAVLWNAFKKIASRYTETERDAMFRGTATRIYRLEPGV
jgi:predicted TIM-barrel fold metal-dependent hydrolase